MLAVLAAIFLVTVLATGRGGRLGPPLRDGVRPILPDDGIGAEDLSALRLAVGVRGYRMDQVDEVLDRLGEELTRREQRTGELEARLAELEARAED